MSYTLGFYQKDQAVNGKHHQLNVKVEARGEAKSSGSLDRRTLVTGVPQSPRDIRADSQHIRLPPCAVAWQPAKDRVQMAVMDRSSGATGWLSLAVEEK